MDVIVGVSTKLMLAFGSSLWNKTSMFSCLFIVCVYPKSVKIGENGFLYTRIFISESYFKFYNLSETLKVIIQEITKIDQCKISFTSRRGKLLSPAESASHKNKCNIRLKNARTTKVDQDLSIFGTCWRKMVQMTPRCWVIPLERLCNYCRKSSILKMFVWQEA